MIVIGQLIHITIPIEIRAQVGIGRIRSEAVFEIFREAFGNVRFTNLLHFDLIVQIAAAYGFFLAAALIPPAACQQ